MIISANPAPFKEEFDDLLLSTLNELNRQAKLKSKYLTGRELEPQVFQTMKSQAVGTPFEHSIELVSGQKFPDIVANNYYGVEVKSTIQNHWTTTGNSVTETTRVRGIERIYMMFGKLAPPIEFKCKPYEECLADVVVTHSPRYLINMDLEVGTTIFDKMKMPYDKLRSLKEPIEPIKNYYGRRLRQGQYSWWLPTSSSLIIKLWNTLSIEEKHAVRINGFVLFPELFSNANTKFDRLALWMVQSESIVCKNIRDVYTAGGQVTLKINGTGYKNIPRVIKNVLDHLPEIFNQISTFDLKTLSAFWNVKITKRDLNTTWLNLVCQEYTKSGNALDIKILFEEYISENNIQI